MKCSKCISTYLGVAFTKFDNKKLVVFIRRCNKCYRFSVGVQEHQDNVRPKMGDRMPKHVPLVETPTEDEIRINKQTLKEMGITS